MNRRTVLKALLSATAAAPLVLRTAQVIQPELGSPRGESFNRTPATASIDRTWRDVYKQWCGDTL